MREIAFDKSKIENLLKDIGTLVDARVSFFDCNLKEVVGYEKKKCRFCVILRGDKRALKRCLECDTNAFKIAIKTKSLYVYECHAGLVEAVSPIYCDNKLLGFLMLGKILKVPPSEDIWKVIYKKCKGYNVDFDRLKEAFFELQPMDDQMIMAAARLIDTCARYIHLTGIAQVRYPDIVEKVVKYVDDNIGRFITASDISKYLYISKSYLIQKVKSELGMTLSEYIRKRKIEVAKVMLEETDVKISEIAEKVGYSDINYFSRVFKKTVGFTATQYRTMYSKSNIALL